MLSGTMKERIEREERIERLTMGLPGRTAPCGSPSCRALPAISSTATQTVELRVPPQRPNQFAGAEMLTLGTSTRYTTGEDMAGCAGFTTSSASEPSEAPDGGADDDGGDST
ncbi:MAG: hypothetical protein ACLUI3_00770 [Christensenellales bacterium]